MHDLFDREMYRARRLGQGSRLDIVRDCWEKATRGEKNEFAALIGIAPAAYDELTRREILPKDLVGRVGKLFPEKDDELLVVAYLRGELNGACGWKEKDGRPVRIISRVQDGEQPTALRPDSLFWSQNKAEVEPIQRDEPKQETAPAHKSKSRRGSRGLRGIRFRPLPKPELSLETIREVLDYLSERTTRESNRNRIAHGLKISAEDAEAIMEGGTLSRELLKKADGIPALYGELWNIALQAAKRLKEKAA